MVEMIKQAITDHSSEKISTKRIVVFLLTFLLATVIIAHVFFQKTIAEYVYNGLIESVIWSMGFIGSEKFVEAIPSFMNSRKGKSTPIRNQAPIPNDDEANNV